MYLHEVLAEVASTPSAVEKAKVLRKHNSIGLRDFLKGSFDDSIQWNLPKGDVPYTPFDLEDKELGNPTPLDKVSPQLAIFVLGNNGTKLAPVMREGKFIRFIENLHPEDAKYILLMKDKKMAGVIKGLTKKVVAGEFPTLILK
jgi:hypothetical protein